MIITVCVWTVTLSLGVCSISQNVMILITGNHTTQDHMLHGDCYCCWYLLLCLSKYAAKYSMGSLGLKLVTVMKYMATKPLSVQRCTFLWLLLPWHRAVWARRCDPGNSECSGTEVPPWSARHLLMPAPLHQSLSATHGITHQTFLWHAHFLPAQDLAAHSPPLSSLLSWLAMATLVGSKVKWVVM